MQFTIALFKTKRLKIVSQGIAAALAALGVPAKKSSAAIVSTSPPDPPHATCLNCDDDGHPPWLCDEPCHVSICQAARKRAHKGRDCPYYDQMKRGTGIKKPPGNAKKSASVNALVKAAMSIVDTAETDDDDYYDPWEQYFSRSG